MKLSSSTTTTSDRLTTVLSYGALLLLAYLVFRIFEPFFEPLAWSAVLAIFFYPVHEYVKRRLPTNRAALVSTLGVTLLLIAPALVILVYTTRQAIDIIQRLQGQVVGADIVEFNPRMDPLHITGTVCAKLLKEIAAKMLV